MKANNLLLLFIILFSIACKDETVEEVPKAPEKNVWIEKSKFPGGHLTDATSFKIGDKLYVGTGIHNVATGDFYEYTHQTDTWRKIGWLPSYSRGQAIGFSVGNYGYVGLGENFFNYYTDLWRYDPQSDSWTELATFPGTPTAKSTCFVVGENAYVVGVSADGKHELWEYRTRTDIWVKKSDYPGQGSFNALSFSVRDKGYVGFGYSYGANYGPANDLWEYDPVKDSWTEKTSFPGKVRGGAVTISLPDKGLVACGGYSTGTGVEKLTDIWEYKPETDKWTKIDTDYPGKGRSGLIGNAIGDKIIMGLGSDGTGDIQVGRRDDIWVYIP